MTVEDLAYAGAITLVTTHVLWLPVLALSWKYQLSLVSGVILNILLFSTTYHACLSFSACPLDTSPAATRRVDNWTSLTGLCVGILLLVAEVPATAPASLYRTAYGQARPREKVQRATLPTTARHLRAPSTPGYVAAPFHATTLLAAWEDDTVATNASASGRDSAFAAVPWDYTRILYEQHVLQTLHSILALGIFVIVFTSDIDSASTFVYCIGFALMLCFAKVLVMGEPAYWRSRRAVWATGWLIAIGFLLTAIGAVFFALPNYLLSHNIWHVLVPIGVLCIATGVARPELSPRLLGRAICSNARRLRSCCTCRHTDSAVKYEDEDDDDVDASDRNGCCAGAQRPHDD